MNLLLALIILGEKWSTSWRQIATGNSQLHLLLQAFPPPRDQSVAYRTLVVSAIKAGLSPLTLENAKGQSALHLFCIQLGTVTKETFPDAGNVLHALLHACFDQATLNNPANGLKPDKSGKTILDISESVVNSWLSLSRNLLAQSLSRLSSGDQRGILLEISNSSSYPTTRHSAGEDVIKNVLRSRISSGDTTNRSAHQTNTNNFPTNEENIHLRSSHGQRSSSSSALHTGGSYSGGMIHDRSSNMLLPPSVRTINNTDYANNLISKDAPLSGFRYR